MNMHYWIQEYKTKLPYILLFYILGLAVNYTLSAFAWYHFITIFVFASIIVVYWGKQYPATGEFQLKNTLTNPLNLLVFGIALVGTILSYKLAPYLGYKAPFTLYTIHCLALSILMLLIILDRSRYTK